MCRSHARDAVVVSRADLLVGSLAVPYVRVMQEDSADRAQEMLHGLLGEDAAFRDGQLEAITALADRRARLLVVQRTGWGKSVVYFIATKLLRDAGAGPTIIISPLLALMRDQLAAAAKLGLRSETINSTNTADWRDIERRLLAGDTDVLLISPERLNNTEFRVRLLTPLMAATGLFVVDEAHCISDWGHDFRPDYRRIVRVLGLMPSSVPVLCTTATANDRVVKDIQGQLGNTLEILRGSLDRKSLALSVHKLDSRADRLAWMAGWIPQTHGSGIVYCLTVGDTHTVADWLTWQGVNAVAYSGDTAPEERLQIEDQLRANEVEVVVATSALGMGYDKPDLSFVIHFQSPDSPVAYYQQVGRAGRALPRADAVLLVGREDAEIWRYFVETSLPVQAHLELVVSLLEESMDWVSLPKIESRVNLSRGRLQAQLKILEVEDAVEQAARKYRRTLAPWRFDSERVERVRQARLAEQELMREYAATSTCRMSFLRLALDDPMPTPCGRCDRCTGGVAQAVPDRSLVRVAQTYVRNRPVTIEPRKMWAPPRHGKIAVSQQLQIGRGLAILSDAGWGRDLIAAHDQGTLLSQEVVNAAAELVRDWLPGFGGAVVPVPKRDPRRLLVSDFAERLADSLGARYAPCIGRTRKTQPQHVMENSAQQFANVNGAFAITGPAPRGKVLLIDDVSNSRWTMTVIAEVLARAGAAPVYPLVIAKSVG